MLGIHCGFFLLSIISVCSSTTPLPIATDHGPGASTCGVVPESCPRSRYRTIDGSCNNLQHPGWGVPQTPYARLAPHNYADNIYKMPVAKSGKPLPNVRTISLTLFFDIPLLDPEWTLLTMQWGQLLAHDMSLTAGVTQSRTNPITCCTSEGKYAADVDTHPQCAPIAVPLLDPVSLLQPRDCLNYVRTTSARDRGCTEPDEPSQPLTTVTAFIDGSNLYGSSPAQASPLRAGAGGRLLTEARGGVQWPPREPNSTEVCEGSKTESEACYLTGDIRSNQNLHLAILQVMLVRDHNRIADFLAKINPHWDDEKIFQETRRIVIAKLQCIAYYELLPIYLGEDNMIQKSLISPNRTGYFSDYDATVDPAVLDEHAAAAFRNFHTLIWGKLFQKSENRLITDYVYLSDHLNRPSKLEDGSSFDELTVGAATQPQGLSDQWWDKEITQKLFKRGKVFGSDLRAVDIQRSRDHGVAPYVVYLAACGLSVPKTFLELTKYMSVANVLMLKTLYKNVEDIELSVAASLEKNVPGTLAGPTNLCIMTTQFKNTRKGDRYFFENGADPDIAFTPDQLKEIRKVTAARFLCDNSNGVRKMQPQAFRLISLTNRLGSCDDLPTLDLNKWRDDE